MSVQGFLLNIPKVELNVLLEGSIRPASLLSLARKNRVTLPADDEAGIRKWFRCRGFSQFVEIYQTVSRCLRDPEDFHLLALDFLAEQAVQNVRYSEVHFTVSTHAAHGVDTEAVRQALVAAAQEGEKRHQVRLRLIPDIVRAAGPHAADQTLEWALAAKDDLTVALGLSGPESAPSAPYHKHFEVASREGLHRVACAGEHGGPKSIREVLDSLAPERIDHGVRAVEDEALVAELVEQRLPLTICPTSNLALGVAGDLASHPFDRLYRRGANVSVNSDCPQLFNTNLTREYLKLHETFGYDAKELAELALAALRQSFLPAEERQCLEEEFRRSMEEIGQRFLGREIFA